MDDIPQGSAMEILREAIPHGGVQHLLPVGTEGEKISIFYQDPKFVGLLLKKGEG